MALVYQKLTLEVTPGAIPPVLHVTEYDLNMQIDVTFTQRGQPYEIPSGTTAKVDGTLAGHPFRENCTVNGNTVTFILSENMTAYAGRAWTKIVLTNSTLPVSTCGFWIDCDRAGVEAETVIGAPGFDEQIQDAVDNYLDEHPVGVEVDPTLSIDGAAADAKATGDNLGDLKSALLYRAVDDIDIGLFEKGSLNNGADSTWGQNARIRTKILLALNDFYIFSIHPQARTSIYIMDSAGSFVSVGEWQLTCAIKQGTIFRLLLGGNYTSTTEELTISEIFSRFQIFTISETEKINNTIVSFNSQNEFADIDFPSASLTNGVDLLFDGGKFVVNGTTSAEVKHNIYLGATKLPGKLSASDLITWNIKRSSTNLVLVRYIQTTDDNTWHGEEWLTSNANADGVYQEIIDDNVTGWLLRIYIPANVTLTNDYLQFSCTREQPNTITEESGPVIAANTDRKHTKLIEDALAKYGCVTIGKGTHIINNLHMPDNSTIRGCGNSSILQTSDSTAHGIIPGTYCTIEDIKIVGTRTGASFTRANDAGIYIVGNYDESPLKRNTKINNCFIYGFGLAGIYGKSTGYWVANSISATNCEICICYAGILLEDFCEFNRFTNMLCYSNYVGLMNRSGNNVFVNCSFSNNTVGIYLACDDEDHALSGNNGHGAVIGATINHSNNNNGYGVIVKGVETNGFVFDSCQLWYSKVQVENSSGVIMQGCTFGGGTPVVESFTNNAFFLRNNLFKVAPSLTGAMIKDGNYLFDGTAVN